MTIFDPAPDNVFMPPPPHVKSDSPGTQTEEDMALETSQLMIRSPDPAATAAAAAAAVALDHPLHQHQQQQDPHRLHQHHQQQQQQQLHSLHSHQQHHHHPTPMSIEQPYKKFRYDPWSVEYLCSDPTSPLANIPLESIFEFSAFQLLSSNEQDELARLLPTVDATTTTTTTNNNTNSESNKTITEAFFSKDQNPIFWNALDDWQTMLAHGELGSNSSSSNTTTYTTTTSSSTTDDSSTNMPCVPPEQQTTLTTTSSDSFKDEAFETYWGELNDRDKMHNVAGDSKNITLKDMCRKGLIRERDVIVYKRNFSACKVVVSKSMTVVKADGATGISIELDNEIFEDFETPTALETKILDQHGKVSKDKRPNGNAFKSIRLLRGGKDLGRLFDIRKDGFGEN